MSGSPAARLLAAADLVDKRAGEANPGPWFYNSYSAVFSQPMIWPYDEFHPEDDGHELNRANSGTCEPCGDWREPLRYPDGTIHWTWPRGHGCKFYDEEYDKESLIASVPSHHGDTAIRRRQADAQYIATMHPGRGRLLALLLRSVSAGVEDHYRHINPNWADEFRDEIVASMVHGYTEALALADALLAGEAK